MSRKVYGCADIFARYYFNINARYPDLNPVFRAYSTYSNTSAPKGAPPAYFGPPHPASPVGGQVLGVGWRQEYTALSFPAQNWCKFDENASKLYFVAKIKLREPFFANKMLVAMVTNVVAMETNMVAMETKVVAMVTKAVA